MQYHTLDYSYCNNLNILSTNKETKYVYTKYLSGLVLESSVKLSHMFPTASIKFGFCFNAAAADAIDGSIFAIVFAYATAIFRKLKYLDSYCTRLSCLRKFHCRCITSVQTLYNLIAWSIQRCVLQISYLIDTITTIFAGNGHLKFYA